MAGFFYAWPLGTAHKKGPAKPGPLVLGRGGPSDRAFDHHLFDIRNRLRRVQTLWTGFRAIHDRVTAIQLERVFQIIKPLASGFVAAVDDPAIGMQQGRWPQVPIAVPPIAGARR